MAMSIGDANDVQHVLQHLAGAKTMTREDFLAAVERLGDRSSKVLAAGYPGASLRGGVNRRKSMGFNGG